MALRKFIIERDIPKVGTFEREPPNAAFGCGTLRAPSLTQSTHWWPTAADRMHSGHT